MAPNGLLPLSPGWLASNINAVRPHQNSHFSGSSDCTKDGGMQLVSIGAGGPGAVHFHACFCAGGRLQVVGTKTRGIQSRQGCRSCAAAAGLRHRSAAQQKLPCLCLPAAQPSSGGRRAGLRHRRASCRPGHLQTQGSLQPRRSWHTHSSSSCQALQVRQGEAAACCQAAG